MTTCPKVLREAHLQKKQEEVSPTKYIVQKVLQSINDEVVCFGKPNIKDLQVFKLTFYRGAIKNADIIVFLVAHDEFKGLSIPADKVVLDFCGVRNK